MKTTEFEIIKDLSEGYSKQSKIANQFWLVLMISSIWTLTSDKTGNLELPFALGKVNDINFLILCIVIICVLVIAYCSAMIQSIRTRKLIQNVLDKMSEEEKCVNGIHIQDYLDSVILPTYSRVAPIAQYLLGKNQFMKNRFKQSQLTRVAALIFYLLLKLISFGFTYFTPCLAVFICLSSLIWYKSIHQFPLCAVVSLIVITSICITILFVGEIKNLRSVITHIK